MKNSVGFRSSWMGFTYKIQYKIFKNFELIYQF